MIIFNKLKMRRGQFTLFLMLGLILLTMFGLILFVAVRSETTVTSLRKNAFLENALEMSDMKHLIVSCLERVSDKAFYLAGQQAGVITKKNLTRGGQIDFVEADLGSKQMLKAERRPGIFGIPHQDADGNYYYLTYALRAPNYNDPKNPKLKPPQYPYAGSLTSDLQKVNDDDPFGHAKGLIASPTNFNALCNTYGSNKKLLEGARYSCENNLYYHTMASQDFLEGYIEQELQSCIDTSFFYDESKITVMAGNNPSAEILFGENYTYVLANYPVTFLDSGGVPTTTTFSYALFKPIRYKLIYELAYHLARRDVEDIFFNKLDDADDLFACAAYTANPDIHKIERTDYTSPCLYANMSIRAIANPCGGFCQTAQGRYADIIVISDNLSTVLNKPYEFKFLVENRAPALDYIDESVIATTQPEPYSPYQGYYYYLLDQYSTSPDSLYNGTHLVQNQLKNYQSAAPDYYTLLTEQSPLGRGISADPKPERYNIVTYVGQPIQIKPRAIDPDEEPVRYHYTGWRTPVRICNQTGNGATDCREGTTNPAFLSLNNKDGEAYTDIFYTSQRSGVFTSGGEPLDEEGYENKNYWETSAEYLVTKKDASYLADYYDIGYHWVRIMAEDEEGKYDFQDVKIQVRCDPTDPEHGGCCDVANDYHPAPAGTKGTCKPCYSCGAFGSCVPDLNLHNDCGACGKCSLNAFQEPQCFADDEDFSNLCEKKIALLGGSSNDAKCCGGSCYDVSKDIGKPWKTQDKDEQCYTKESVVDSQGNEFPLCRLDYETGKKRLTYPVNIQGDCSLAGDKGCIRCGLSGVAKGKCVASETPDAFLPEKDISKDQYNFYYAAASGAAAWVGINAPYTSSQKNFFGQCSGACSGTTCAAPGSSAASPPAGSTLPSTATQEITVRDMASNVLLGGAITTLKSSTNQEFQTVTGADGRAVFLSMPLGFYRLRVAAPGYIERSNLILQLSQANQIRSNTISLQKLCAPDCAGKNCGDDGCGGQCGFCAMGMSCLNGQCN